MTALLLTGKDHARALLDALRQAVSENGRSRPPCLLVAGSGVDEASAHYVRSIRRVAAQVGVEIATLDLGAEPGFAEFQAGIERAARDAAIDGIQVQKPIPEDRTISEALERIPPEKDVEGLHPENVGLLALGRPRFVPCTAAAVVRLLDHHRIELAGKRVAIVGRSDIVGKPLATLLLGRNATVTLCHRKTRDLPGELARAEIVVAAAGAPELVRTDWLSQGSVVVDVGHNVLPGGRAVGDVETTARERVAAISPVPGGVGPLTVVELLTNVVRAAGIAI